MARGSHLKNYVDIDQKVKEALGEDKPVLALESTLIAHGFPCPQNYELAIELEEYARSKGVVPATVAVIDGKVKVGLTKEEIKHIATDENVRKASLRDLPVLVAKGLDGGTTVASTVQIADLVGIKFFVTGGIGGVHPNFKEKLDISADLQALSRYHVAVVSAGAKSVLDLAKTRERLETLGVPVLGYKCDNFPAFYIRDSGLSVDYRVDSPEEAIRVLETQQKIGSHGGTLITTPIPKEDELDPERHQEIMESLIEEAESRGISGKDITPFLLHRLVEETNGKSIEANISLIKNNLSLGCKLVRNYRER